ncbi:MAG: hypothetical protein JWO80_6172, partial [Bryobacterales bacterium]|nr:hypothetical protein [Bryobacterales bacterium]MCU1263287.1 hypothetical protein [Bryobacterales bacterium]
MNLNSRRTFMKTATRAALASRILADQAIAQTGGKRRNVIFIL